MQFDLVSIFPEMITQWFEQGVVGRAVAKELITINTWNPREYSEDRHQRVDDRPFGGGPGMVMQYAPLAETANAINASEPKPFHVYLSPQGEPLTQALAGKLAEQPRLALWCGRYEGVDQRFIDQHIDLEISIGDFVLSGGELAAAVLIDTVSRLIPGVLGDANSAAEDSFQQAIFDHPHYTRPEIAGRIPAPEILLSGNHAHIAKWRLKEALGRTFLQRPDLITRLVLTTEQEALLAEFLQEYHIGEL
ncbi:tRNA (guanosine(37)-N1)-methyltransferase TrmD [Suttonella sp. R2A3]|uniref:tRNA (guanosine(37)-N1)-methyltransferase TrmD n=1 Tax=Suttonella sp. R2A3 TaxID=2908648 RepID=UPI001F2397E9|nr:tRNA (guanosine(37)-N1)-methyltransferase TrmD [Suttonella sp. R2A3]UJF25205.1 tRNA (guanosine(37)-N1)-methyltransferase TrmD [Suttonella sp. R2A3]